jgi:hypothetical protein
MRLCADASQHGHGDGSSRLDRNNVGHGRPIVLLHTLPTQLDYFDLLLRQLDVERAKLIAVDLPGHGESSAPSVDYGRRGGIRRSSGLANVLFAAMLWPLVGPAVDDDWSKPAERNDNTQAIPGVRTATPRRSGDFSSRENRGRSLSSSASSFEAALLVSAPSSVSSRSTPAALV